MFHGFITCSDFEEASEMESFMFWPLFRIGNDHGYLKVSNFLLGLAYILI